MNPEQTLVIPTGAGKVRVEAPEGYVRIPIEEPGHWVSKPRDILAEVCFRSGEREASEFTLQSIGESVVETQDF